MRGGALLLIALHIAIGREQAVWRGGVGLIVAARGERMAAGELGGDFSRDERGGSGRGMKRGFNRSLGSARGEQLGERLMPGEPRPEGIAHGGIERGQRGIGECMIKPRLRFFFDRGQMLGFGVGAEFRIEAGPGEARGAIGFAHQRGSAGLHREPILREARPRRLKRAV